MPGRHKKNSTDRRRSAAEKRSRLRPLAMRTCQACVNDPSKPRCVITQESLSCTECDKYRRQCDLSPNYLKWDKALRQEERIEEEILELQMKLARKRKEQKHWLRVRRELGDREAQNILELEEDERLESERESGRAENPSATPPTLDDIFGAPLSPGTIAAWEQGFPPLHGTVAEASGTS